MSGLMCLGVEQSGNYFVANFEGWGQTFSLCKRDLVFRMQNLREAGIDVSVESSALAEINRQERNQFTKTQIKQ